MKNDRMTSQLRKALLVATLLGLAFHIPADSFAARARKKGTPAAGKVSPARSNRVAIRTSDGTFFHGTLEDKDGGLVLIKTDDGEELNLPLEEIKTINGLSPASFFKKFMPVIPESLFQTMDVTVGGKVRYAFKFLSAWQPSKLSNGYVFSGPDDDPRWEGYSFAIYLESPSSIPGDFNYASILKKVASDGNTVLSESYDMTLGTQTLRTTEMNKGAVASRNLRQIRTVGGEKRLLEISLSHQVKEKLNRPLAISLFEKVVGSLKFLPPSDSSPGKPATP